jgi:uncharacterized membrane protein
MPADDSKQRDRALALGLALGAAFGVLIGLVFFGNPALGVVMGPPLGMVVALGIMEFRRPPGGGPADD